MDFMFQIYFNQDFLIAYAIHPFLSSHSVSLEEYPFIITVKNESSEHSKNVVCLGSIIGQLNNYGIVLTAGSCILEMAADRKSVFVIEELKTGEEYYIYKWNLPTYQIGEEPEIGLIAIKGVWKGLPKYSLIRPWKIRPAPTGGRPRVGILGFDWVKDPGLNDIKINKNIKILTRDKCQNQIGFILTNTTFCVGNINNVAERPFYSFVGGPVLAFRKGEPTLIGVTINSPQRLSTDSPAVAVNISLYENFIGNIFWMFDKKPSYNRKSTQPFNINFCKAPLVYDQVTPDDVTVYLYTRNNRNDGIKLKVDAVRELPKPFDPRKRSLFLIHGWTGSYTADIEQVIKQAALDATDLNVFLVDWAKPAKMLGSLVVPFIPSIQAVPKVGSLLGDFIYQIISNYDYSPNEITIIGHSLGAHVAGCAGARVITKSGKKIKYIIGSDPAGPCYFHRDKSERLDETDAQFVEIVHTAMGTWGINRQIGSADYYVNGGTGQPGCSDMLPTDLINLIGIRNLDGILRSSPVSGRNFYSQITFMDNLVDILGCSHQRSFKYIAESIKRNCGFISNLCDGWVEYREGVCWNTSKSYIGRLDMDDKAHGNYYLRTNSRPPYSKETCSPTMLKNPQVEI